MISKRTPVNREYGSEAANGAGSIDLVSAVAVLAGTAVHTSTIIVATKTIAMTTLQKTLIATALTAAIGTGVYEAHQNYQLRNEVRTLQRQQAPLTEQIRQLQRERAEATNRLAALLAENAQLKSSQSAAELLKLHGELTQLRKGANGPMSVAAKAWLVKVNKLKQRLEETPTAKIPELQFLTEQDWLGVASGKLDKDADYRSALAALRTAGKNKFGRMLQPALQKYSQTNHGQFPTDLSQLQPYFDSPVDDAILDRWKIVAAKNDDAEGLGVGSYVTEKTPVDESYDSYFAVSLHGFSSGSDYLSSEVNDTLGPVFKAFSEANNREKWADYSQLLPYATTSDQQALLQKLIKRDAERR